MNQAVSCVFGFKTIFYPTGPVSAPCCAGVSGDARSHSSLGTPQGSCQEGERGSRKPGSPEGSADIRRDPGDRPVLG